MYSNFAFDITYQDPKSRARLGSLKTPHGTVETPAFIFCATKGSIKGVTPEQMKAAGTQIILTNTYHMMLQPGADLVEEMGGMHRFCGWNGPMLTDSGGFQIFSLGHGSVAAEIKGKRSSKRPMSLTKITEEGALFKSYLDGTMHLLTPEKSIEVQRKIGTDIILVFDECTPFHVEKSYTEKSMELSHRWALRSLQEFERHNNGAQALYGIIQGGIYPEFRKRSAKFVNSHPFFGHAVGGSLGASKSQMLEVVDITTSLLERARPIHLLGIGGIRDIFAGVKYGIDTFDCVHPTRIARHGAALIKGGEKSHIQLSNAKYRKDQNPIDEKCPCPACKTVSKGYLHHLLRAKEITALHLITLHNVTFMNQMLEEIRIAIQKGTLDALEKEWLPKEDSLF